jgi:large subunit ribosomal protein L30
MAKQLKITQVKSLIGRLPKHKRTMQAIGFRRHQQSVVKRDTAQLRGMLEQVRHLVRIEEDGAAPAPKAKTASPKAKAKSTKTATSKAKAAKPKTAKKAKAKASGTAKKKTKGSAKGKDA